VGERLTPEDFNNLFGRFQQEAFRLEVQPVYALDYEREAFDAFLRGESHPATDYDWYRPWLDQIRKATGQGRRVARVRVLAEPPTNYQRLPEEQIHEQHRRMDASARWAGGPPP
jgi:hypothetical protein